MDSSVSCKYVEQYHPQYDITSALDCNKSLHGAICSQTPSRSDVLTF